LADVNKGERKISRADVILFCLQASIYEGELVAETVKTEELKVRRIK